MQKLMADEGGGVGPCFSLLTPSVCGFDVFYKVDSEKRSANGRVCDLRGCLIRGTTSGLALSLAIVAICS